MKFYAEYFVVVEAEQRRHLYAFVVVALFALFVGNYCYTASSHKFIAWIY